MAKEKRKDTKGRNLRERESQRKDGRYVYKYIDIFGNPQSVYSWKLVPTDKIPAGKRDDISLREKVAQINKDLADGIDTVNSKMTVCQLYEKKNNQRKNVKRNTKVGRQHLMTILENDILGVRKIDTVKLSDGREWAIRMSEKGYSYKTIENYKRSLRASFYMAIQDDCIRKNPFDFKLSDVLEDDTKPKAILTPEQEQRLLAFMLTDNVYNKYRDEVIILLETGLRISELCGLTHKDIDMVNRIINIDHQLLKDSEDGYYVDTPKTKNGVRQLPMTENAYQAFVRINRKRKKKTITVDGYTGFLFLNRNGLPKTSGNYESMVHGLIKKYNKTHSESEQLPAVTPHSFRHTYCTNMANKGMNPNTLQYVMGHANITMTLGYYAHGSFESARAEIQRLVA